MTAAALPAAAMRSASPTASWTATADVVVAVFAVNEHVKLQRTLSRFPAERDYDLLVVDDGSTDGSCASLPAGVHLLRNEVNTGIGASMRRAIRWARERGYRVIVMMAGNDKDRPEEISRLLAPIRDEGCAIVQGSRYLGGGAGENMPRYRRWATRHVHPLVFRMAAGRWMTDTTNGFRAMRLDLFDDARIDLDQAWLDRYELEPYVLAKTIRLGYRVAEVPVSKIYPPKQLGYTKMRPIVDWWRIMRPLVYMATGIRR